MILAAYCYFGCIASWQAVQAFGGMKTMLQMIKNGKIDSKSQATCELSAMKSPNCLFYVSYILKALPLLLRHPHQKELPESHMTRSPQTH